MENKAIETVVNGEEITEIDYSQIVTEDDTLVDNLFSEKQQRLLTEPLYASWQPADQRTFAVFANVGLFYALRELALVPDAMLSMDIALPADVWEKPNRSYFVWQYGKVPEVVIEVVANLKELELTDKMDKYAKMAVPFYVVYDPAQHYGSQVLRIYENHSLRYLPSEPAVFAPLGLGLMLWDGEYEGLAAQWLRWCTPKGQLIATGKERADAEHQRAEAERQHADRLAQKLRELGIDE
jgi:Putative restriction endonuclease